MLTRNGYKVAKSPETMGFKKQLTVKPYVPAVFVNPRAVKSYPVYHETESFLYLPKQFGIQHLGQPASVECKSVRTPDEYWMFTGALREAQQEVVDAYLKPEAKDGLICLQTGGGKTVCGLYIASQLKLKTLIVVNNTFLRDQWKERIEGFLPRARIGTIQGETTDVANKDIIIAMIQSISMKEYPKEVFAGIGLTIVDECHHIASEVFVRAFPKITSQHMLGLSATPERKDGLMHVISWFMGPILYKSEGTDKEDNEVQVEVYAYKHEDPEFNKIVYNQQGVMFTSVMVTKLAEFEPRTAFLADLLGEIMQESSRQILLLTDRVQHCKDILATMKDKEKACILESKVPAATRSEWCATKQVLIATYAMCKEGFDVPSLNTLIMATPRPDIEQIVGRILRTERSKRTVPPLIVDIVDETFRRQFQERLSLYKKRKYAVSMMKLE